MREKKRFELEVHVAGICFRKRGEAIEVLIAKRASTRQLFPGKWECGGGQVKLGENFSEAVKRELKEELNVETKVIAPLNSYEIAVPQLAQKKIPGICFLCEWIENEPQVDGEELVEWQWRETEKIDEIDFIPGLLQQIKKGAALFKKERAQSKSKEGLSPLSAQAKSIVVGGFYEHFKGGRYKVLEIARHSETLEELVVYQALYGEKGVWVRPLSMFVEEIEIGNGRRPRFKLMQE